MSEAWKLKDGFKGTAIAGAAIFWALNFGLQWVGRFVIGSQPSFPALMAWSFVASLTLAPVSVGFVMLPVRRAAGLPVSVGRMFGSFDVAGAAIVGTLLSTLLTYVGLVFLILPGIYLGVAWMMMLPLIGDRRLGAWEAMEISRKAVTKKWWSVFGLLFVVGVLFGLSACFLLIPLFWTGPWALLVIGVLYRRIFGVAQTA